MVKKRKIKILILLQTLLLLYSLGGIFSKFAGQAVFLSVRFFIFYGLVLCVLAVYAVLWQQIIKRVPLVTAYANKAVTVIWGLIWGSIVFGERITTQNIIGALIIMVGIIMVVKSDE